MWCGPLREATALYDLSFLRGELEYLCGHHRRSFMHFQLCLQHTTHLRQQIACFKQLIRLKTIAGEDLLALLLGIRALNLLRFSIGGLTLDAKQWGCDQRVAENIFAEIILTLRDRGCEGDVAKLLSILPLCSDSRMQMVSDILAELIYPAHLTSQTLLQLMVFTTVQHTLRNGLCKHEAFAFCMFGASLLAKAVHSDSFWAKSAQQWGALGLNLCLRFNQQSDYCRSLMANALFINSFTGHLERSIRELKQAIYIGSMCGDLQFVTQSSLGIVLLQQYTSSLTSWGSMIRQMEGENFRSLQDRSIQRFCQGMLMLIDSVQGDRGLQQQQQQRNTHEDVGGGADGGGSSCGSQRGAGGGRRSRSSVPRTDPDAYSPAERRFVEVCQAESPTVSVHLSLYAITKAKLQFLHRAPGAAIDTLKLVNFELIVGLPEVVTYLFVQSLANLALLREFMNNMTMRRAAARQRARKTRHDSATVAAAAAAAGGATPMSSDGGNGTDEADEELPEAQADAWRLVNRNQISLSRYSTSNPRDFHFSFAPGIVRQHTSSHSPTVAAD